MLFVLILMLVLVALSTALLLGIDRVGSGQEEGEDQKGQKDELVVENEHCVGSEAKLVVRSRDLGEATVVKEERES